MRSAILAETDLPAQPKPLFDSLFAFIQHSAASMYAIGDPPDYEPTPDRTVAAIAATRGADPLATMYDLMLESGGTAMLTTEGTGRLRIGPQREGEAQERADKVLSMSTSRAEGGLGDAR